MAPLRRNRPWRALLAAALLLVSFQWGCTLVRPAPEPVVVERGVASWYGPKFHGRRTANGERYDMHAMTAAHPSLPFGTVLEVRNLDNGKNVRVRINDRGPFVHGRVVDVSYAAARQLGLVRPGTARVELAVIAPREAPAGLPTEPVVLAAAAGADGERTSLSEAVEGDFTVQVGAFAAHDRAETLRRLLASHYPSAAVRSDGSWHRVHVGRFEERGAAEELRRELEGLGWAALVVVVR